MTQHDKTTILDLALGRISEQEFFREFSVAAGDIGAFVGNTLNHSLQARNFEDVEYPLLLLYSFRLYDSSLDPVIRQLLVEDWHFKHEDLVGIVDAFRIKGTEEHLFKLATMHLPYLDYDENFGLARKCTWALAKLDTPAAREKLQLLAGDPNKQIAAYARKRLGG